MSAPSTLVCGRDGASALAGIDYGTIPTHTVSETGRRDAPEQRGRATDDRSQTVAVGTAALCGRFGAPPIAAEFGGSEGCALTGVGSGARSIYPVRGDGRRAVPGPRKGRADQNPSFLKIPYPFRRAPSPT